MIGIPVGLVYANAAEWMIHKHVLHGPGKRRGSFWSFHFHEHHRASRKNLFHDPDYARSGLGRNAKTKELLGVIALAVVHLPLLPVAPFFTATVVYSAAHYYRTHRRSHIDPEWAREHLPWHYDHHMGPDQDKNWGVTRPWIDHLMGTRVPYVGTEREQRDLAKRQSNAA